MSLINLSFFQGEIYIGQISSVDVKENVNWFIHEYEPVYLLELLGQEIYDEYLSETLDLSNNQALKKAIANFVFYHYTISNYAQNSGIGVTIPSSQNAMIVVPIQTSVKAWNRMVDYTDEAIKTIDGVKNNPFSKRNSLEF
jgi:hypothetical protein